MIDKREIEGIVQDSIIEDSSVTIFLYENRGTKRDPISMYEIPADRDVVTELKLITKDYMDKVLETLESEALKKIPLYNPDGGQTVFKIAAKGVPVVGSILPFLTGERPSRVYDRDIIKKGKIKAWIMRFECERGGKIRQLFVLQRFQKSRMLSEDKIFIFQTGKQFKLLKDHTLSLNLDMDLFMYEDTLIATKMSAFEKIFGYEEFYQEDARKFVDELATGTIRGRDCTIKFPDIEKMDTRITSSTRFAHRLHSARWNGYFAKIGYSELESLSARHGLGLTLDGAKKQWIIDEKVDPRVVAQILNDDYERSQLTEIEYLAMGKEPLQGKRTTPPGPPKRLPA